MCSRPRARFYLSGFLPSGELICWVEWFVASVHKDEFDARLLLCYQRQYPVKWNTIRQEVVDRLYRFVDYRDDETVDGVLYCAHEN